MRRQCCVCARAHSNTKRRQKAYRKYWWIKIDMSHSVINNFNNLYVRGRILLYEFTCSIPMQRTQCWIILLVTGIGSSCQHQHTSITKIIYSFQLSIYPEIWYINTQIDCSDISYYGTYNNLSIDFLWFYWQHMLDLRLKNIETYCLSHYLVPTSRAHTYCSRYNIPDFG